MSTKPDWKQNYHLLVGLILGCLLVAIALAWSHPAHSEPVYPRANGTPVLDTAHTFTPEQATQISQRVRAYTQTTGHQMAVVTVSALGDTPISDYANHEYRQLGIGDRHRNDGVMLVLDVPEHHDRIEVGYGLEGALTDLETDRILRMDAAPLLRAGDVVGATLKVVDDVQKLTTPPTAEQVAQRQQHAAQVRAGVAGFFSWVFGGLFTVAAIGGLGWLLMIPMRRRKRRAADEQDRADAAEIAAAHLAHEQANAEQVRRGREAQAQRQADRERKLAAMTPEERAAFLAAEAQEQRNREERQAAQRQAAQARRDREGSERHNHDSVTGFATGAMIGSTYSAPSSDSSSSSSSDSSYDFGGGSSGGGGSDGSW